MAVWHCDILELLLSVQTMLGFIIGCMRGIQNHLLELGKAMHVHENSQDSGSESDEGPDPQAQQLDDLAMPLTTGAVQVSGAVSRGSKVADFELRSKEVAPAAWIKKFKLANLERSLFLLLTLEVVCGHHSRHSKF